MLPFALTENKHHLHYDAINLILNFYKLKFDFMMDGVKILHTFFLSIFFRTVSCRYDYNTGREIGCIILLLGCKIQCGNMHKIGAYANCTKKYSFNDMQKTLRENIFSISMINN